MSLSGFLYIIQQIIKIILIKYNIFLPGSDQFLQNKGGLK